MSTEERAARLLTTLRTTEPEGQKAASVFVLQETSNKMGGKVNCSNQTPKEGERAASTNFSNDVLRSEKCNSHQIPNRPNGYSSSKSSIPTGLPRKKKKAFSYLDSIDRVAMAKAHLSKNSEIQNVVDSVATLVANEIRFGDCWHFEGPRPHHLVVPPSIHRTSKMLKNGSKLVDTRKSLLFGVESSSEQISALNFKVTHTLPWIHQTNITETDHVVATKSENTDNDDDKAAKKLKSCIALSVKRFATDIYYPHLISCKSRICSNSVASDRIMISTLLALREMMTMNADKLFSSFPKAKVSACAGAIIRSCAKKLVSITSNFSFENFLRACQGYDSHRADFRFALVEANAQSACILPDGGKPSTEENMFSRISFNRTRMSHPLVYSENVTKYESPSESTGIDKSYSLTSPSPSLCATFLIKTEQLNSDIKEIDNMLNKSCDETVNEKIYHERISYPEYLLFQQTFRRVKKRT
ncbi:hypothetical protein HJC23_011009 [Cyclotella cryptica]|uniref:Uncharacterized protein n=1 Tax=Cyclotella cryptica TaxID=29204 RepID=A0ABD3Q0F4_9STRA